MEFLDCGLILTPKLSQRNTNLTCVYFSNAQWQKHHHHHQLEHLGSEGRLGDRRPHFATPPGAEVLHGTSSGEDVTWFWRDVGPWVFGRRDQHPKWWVLPFTGQVTRRLIWLVRIMKSLGDVQNCSKPQIWWFWFWRSSTWEKTYVHKLG